MWGAVSDERTGLLFTIAAGPRQRSRSRVRVPWDSTIFSVSDSTLPFSSPPTTRRATVEVIDPAFTRDKIWEDPVYYFPWNDTDRIENDGSNYSSIVAYIFFAAVTFLPSRYLATILESLPSSYLGTTGRNIHVDTQTEERDLLSTALRWAQVPWLHTNFHRNWFRHSKVNSVDTQTHRQHWDRIGLFFLFFKIRKIG
jgi:hypothetical protein